MLQSVQAAVKSIVKPCMDSIRTRGLHFPCQWRHTEKEKTTTTKKQLQKWLKTAIFATGSILKDLLFYNSGETHGISTCGEQPFPINHSE